MCFDLLKKSQLFCCCLVISCNLSCLCNSSLQDLKVWEDKLQINCLNISERINTSIYMYNITCLLYTSIKVSYLGDLVTPARTFCTVPSGTPESSESFSFEYPNSFFLCFISSTVIASPSNPFKNASAFLLRGARHAIAWHPSTAHLCNPAGGYISWGLTPTTDTSLFLTTYRGGSHLPTDIASYYFHYIIIFSI